VFYMAAQSLVAWPSGNHLGDDMVFFWKHALVNSHLFLLACGSRVLVGEPRQRHATGIFNTLVL
jgi:hypothetical protein